MDIAKALADETRVRLLMALDGRQLCVCQLVELADLAPSTVSKHMAILRHARLVESRKKGRWIFYRLSGDGHSPVGQALDWVRQSLQMDSRIEEDRERLEAILRTDPEELCRKQCPR